MSIDQPHHPWFWITSNSAAEPGASTFGRAHCFRLGHKARLEFLGLCLQKLRGTLPARFHLSDPVDGHHALGKLGLIHDSCLARALDDGTGLVCTIEIGRSADVFTRVLRIHPAKVHCHITKVVDGSEASLWGKMRLIEKKGIISQNE